MSIPKIVIVDIDHTLSYAFWRDPMIPNNDWDLYHNESVNDKPIVPFIDIMIGLRSLSYEIIALTSRPEKFRVLTLKWLTRNEVPINGLFMRGDNDFRSATVIKSEFLRGFASSNIAFVMDDNEDLMKEAQLLGMPFLLVYAKRGQ